MASIDDVQDISPRVQYTASAAQTAFTYPFPIFQDADIVVDIDGTLQVLTTDYTVSGAGNETGGTVTLVDAATGGEIVTIYRDIPIARDTDFQQNGPISSIATNDELDKITLILQELENKVGRAVRFPIESLSTNAEAELEPIANYFGKFLHVSSTGILEPVEVATSEEVVNADVINVADSGEFYTASDVEQALAEIFETPSATARRLLELATAAEANTGTDAVRAITPATLPVSTATQKGGVELATQAEVDTGTDTERAVTPATLAGTAIASIDTKIKTSTESRTSDTTLTDDGELAGWVLDTGSYYTFEGFITYIQNAGNFKFKLDFSDTPGPSTLYYSQRTSDQSGNVVHDSVSMVSPETITTMADGVNIITLLVKGAFKSNASDGGTVDFQWAQETSSGNATSVIEGSWLKFTKVS